MKKEIWKPIIVWKKGIRYDYTGKYEVSNLGRIKRLEGVYYCGHQSKQKQIIKGGIMSLSTNPKGYRIIQLSDGKHRDSFTVGRVVWEAFNGQIPEGLQVNHINEDKTDNRLENLNLMTPKENCNWGTHNMRIASAIKGIKRSSETKQKMSECKMGKKNPMYGRRNQL